MARFHSNARATRCLAGLTLLALLGGSAGGGAVAATTSLPDGISSVMHKPRYRNATWRLLVTDLATGKPVYALTPDRMAFTGSVRKLFSVGVALNALGATHRFRTPVYRRGSVNGKGVLGGDLVLVGAGDLTLGGRLNADGSIAIAHFDHNDANNLGDGILTPQDPLAGLNALARQVRASGIRSVTGDVVVDDRLFAPYRVPNGNLLITPILVNENDVDLTVTPAQPGSPATIDWRPKTAAFRVAGSVTTSAAGKPTDITQSDKGLATCSWPVPCVGTIAGSIATGYRSPLSESSTFVRIFRIEQPASFARIAFVQALRRVGVTVGAPTVAPNAPAKLPPLGSYASGTRVAEFVSPTYAQDARLILKVSLNLGANLSLSLFGLTQGQRTVAGALAAERKTLIQRMGVKAGDFTFPTNGSGSPDSQAAPSAVVRVLTAMSTGANATPYRSALPILGVDGSLAGTGTTLPARGHVFAKTGTTLDATGLKAQVLAGYIDAKSGRKLAFALFVNDAGPIKSIKDVAEVFQDEAQITNAIFIAN